MFDTLFGNLSINREVQLHKLTIMYKSIQYELTVDLNCDPKKIVAKVSSKITLNS